MSDLTRDAHADDRHGALRLHPWSSADVEEMGAYWARNREHLQPTQPTRESSFWGVEGQRQRVERAADHVAVGRMLPFLVREDGWLVAEIGLSDVVRGAFCSANVGYSVDGARLRRGIASWAVEAVVDIAFSDLGLHRVQAGTMVDNIASQAVLQRSVFERIGVATRYLAIAGAWRDHVLWQRINEAGAPPG
jgi:[ribosomal protein S5]-alanine N-acetyltransferase